MCFRGRCTARENTPFNLPLQRPTFDFRLFSREGGKNSMRKIHLKLWMVLFIGGFLFLGMLPIWVQAAPPPLPTRPIPTNTPTPTPTPTAIPTATVTPVPEPAQSSSIILQARSTAALEWPKLWTVVEWQDGDGAWQDVEGWQGPFDQVDAAGGHKTWSIPPTLFSRGPFR